MKKERCPCCLYETNIAENELFNLLYLLYSPTNVAAKKNVGLSCWLILTVNLLGGTLHLMVMGLLDLTGRQIYISMSALVKNVAMRATVWALVSYLRSMGADSVLCTGESLLSV